MKRAMVTGANGFVGRHSIRILKDAGYDVHCITSKKASAEADATWHTADLLDDADCRRVVEEIKPTHLLHFAWYTEPGKYWNSELNRAWVKASMGLMKHFRENGGERATLAGTCAEYDWDYGFCFENITPAKPTTLYGQCKNDLRQAAAAFAEREGLSFAWGRIFFLYGPGEHPSRLVPSVITALLKGQEAKCTHGNQVRDFLYSVDVASAFVAVLDSDVDGTVNVASGKPLAIKDIAFKIGELTGHPDLIRLGAIEAPPGEPPLILADTRRLNYEVGWKPKYTLDEGLSMTVEWWKRQLR